jgi:hypothetical protein
VNRIFRFHHRRTHHQTLEFLLLDTAMVRILSILLLGWLTLPAAVVATTLFGNHEQQDIRDHTLIQRQLQGGTNRKPTRRPSSRPSSKPSLRPTRKPTKQPVSTPTRSPSIAKVTLPLTPIKMTITPKNGTQIDYNKLQRVLENQLAAYFINDPQLAASFVSVSLARNTTVRIRALLRTTASMDHRRVASSSSVTTQYDGTATFSQQGAPTAQTLADQQNAALYLEPWSSALQAQYGQMGVAVSYPSNAKNGISGGAIAGIIIAFLALIALFLVMFILKKKKNQAQKEESPKPVNTGKTRVIVTHNPPPPPPPPTRSHLDEMTSDDLESLDDDDDSAGWRKYGIASRQGAITNMKTDASQTSRTTDIREQSQSEIDDYSVSYGDENVEATAGDEFLSRVLALGEFPCEEDEEDDDHPQNGKEKAHNPEAENEPDLSLFQSRDGYIAGTVNYLQHLMSFETEDSHRITVISGSANPSSNEFPNDSMGRRTLTVPATVSEDDENNMYDEDDEDDEDDAHYDQIKDEYGVLSPLSDPSYSPTTASTKSPYVHPEALRERVKSAIANSASPTTQERHNAMYQESATNALFDDSASVTRLASDSRKSRLAVNNTPKEVSIKSGDAAELRKMRLQGNNADAPATKKVKGPIASKNLRKARLAKEHTSARVSKKNTKDMYAV